VEDESSSIKCAATNFKNELTLFFLKDINQLKPTYIASIQIQYTHQSITNRKSFIPKPILRASFQKQLALDQSKTDAHSINSINLHGIRSSFGWKLGSENFHSSMNCFHPVILRGAEGEDAESMIKN